MPILPASMAPAAVSVPAPMAPTISKDHNERSV
jgi:hypothetical protein